MPLTTVRRRTVKAKSNWSHENKGCFGAWGAGPVNNLYQAGAIVVPSRATQGTVTVGNFTITVPGKPATSTTQGVVYWALVYVPQGETAKNLFATTGNLDGSLYEPNQYVISSGMSDTNAGPIRIRTRMMRKLHSGDFVSLILGTPDSEVVGMNFQALVSYSIKYN